MAQAIAALGEACRIAAGLALGTEPTQAAWVDCMSHPRNTEPQANGALARALMRRNPDWHDSTVHAERTQVIQQSVPGTGSRQEAGYSHRRAAPPAGDPGDGVRPGSHGRARRDRKARDELAEHRRGH